MSRPRGGPGASATAAVRIGCRSPGWARRARRSCGARLRCSGRSSARLPARCGERDRCRAERRIARQCGRSRRPSGDRPQRFELGDAVRLRSQARPAASIRGRLEWCELRARQRARRLEQSDIRSSSLAVIPLNGGHARSMAQGWHRRGGQGAWISVAMRAGSSNALEITSAIAGCL